MSIDIGNECTECRKDTSPGSGLFVNRIPSDNGELYGYMCPECQLTECDKCGEPADCSGYSHMYVCYDCVHEAGEKYLGEMTDEECLNFLKEETI